MNTTATYSMIQINQYDPTRTLTLRNAWVRAMNGRFNALITVIRKAIVEDDCFGLMPQTYSPTLSSPGKYAFDFPRTADKLNGFMKWLMREVEKGILETANYSRIGSSVESSWTNLYVQDSYKRGVLRARTEMRKAGYPVPPTGEVFGGVEAIMGTPFHIDRVGLLYTRVFQDLKGITTAMDTQISRILAQGLVDGDHPRILARKLVATINGSGAGELGITDSIGRFIPAKRRAATLARTEVVRAHHAANMQEYKNWGVRGVEVVAEFVTAGDDRVCDECAGYHGNRYTLKEAEHMIPVHPNCFIDPQIPIYTSSGWKPIGKIEVGDFVLTHKHRFRKVTELIRTAKQSPEVVQFEFKGGFHISMTVDHPILVKKVGRLSRWKKAGEFKIGNTVQVLANECKRCGVKIPYFRTYCSRTCLSLDVTDKQWADPEHRKNMSEKASKQLHREYLLGIRDKNTITKQANAKVRELVKEGNFVLQNKEIRESGRHLTSTPELRAASSDRMKNNNPMNDPATREKATKSLLNLYEHYPEKRLNARMAKHRKSNKMTWIEERMCDLLEKLGVNYVSQYPILRYNVDFAIPELKIVIECDGEYWHQDKERDLARQQSIEAEGWFVLRYSGSKINQEMAEIEEELSRVLCNHLGEYGSIPLEIISIKRWRIKKPRTLYNFSVEEDESYVAKGVVVHNCRCIVIPVEAPTTTEWETAAGLLEGFI